MKITTNEDVAALTAGTIVESKGLKRYRLTELIPATEAPVVTWWAVPVTGGRRRRLSRADFTCMGWKVAELAAPPAPEAPAAPRVYDYGMTSSQGTVRHCVEDGADVRALCDRTMRYVFSSIKIEPWSVVATLPTCRGCTAKVKAAGMVTRRRAAELAAEAEVVEQPAPQLPAGASPEFAALVAGALTGRPAVVEVPAAEAEAVEVPAAEVAAPLDAVALDGVPGVWVVTHTPSSMVDRDGTLQPYRFYRLRRIYTGGLEPMPLVVSGADIVPVDASASDSREFTAGVFLTLGNGPVVVPIRSEHHNGAMLSYPARSRSWQRDHDLFGDAQLVTRHERGWHDAAGKLVMPAAVLPDAEGVKVESAADFAALTPGTVVMSSIGSRFELLDFLPATPEYPRARWRVQAEGSASFTRRISRGHFGSGWRVVELATVPASVVEPVAAPPAADDAPPLTRRDLVTYNGIRYVIIRADGAAEVARHEGQVELYPGDDLPELIGAGERGHWVEASACTRRIVLEWGTRYTRPDGEVLDVAHPGRAYAECAVEMAVEFGDTTARLLMRRMGGQVWQVAPMRTRQEREADVAEFVASLRD